MLPWSARGFSGFRLLTEYFAFPEKFLFLDFTRIDAKTLVAAGNRLEIFVYLDRALPELERTVGRQSLALGCMPLVNLFPQRCEPVTAQPHRYRISRRRRCAPAARGGDLEHRAGARNPGGWQVPALAAVPPAGRP